MQVCSKLRILHSQQDNHVTAGSVETNWSVYMCFVSSVQSADIRICSQKHARWTSINSTQQRLIKQNVIKLLCSTQKVENHRVIIVITMIATVNCIASCTNCSAHLNSQIVYRRLSGQTFQQVNQSQHASAIRKGPSSSGVSLHSRK